MSGQFMDDGRFDDRDPAADGRPGERDGTPTAGRPRLQPAGPVPRQRAQRTRSQLAHVRAERQAARLAKRVIPPQRSAELRHLGLDALRTYRSALIAEEHRVSYWRRIVQARLDTLVSFDGRSADPEALRPVLTQQRLARGRTALVKVVPADDFPPLPNLDELWQHMPGEDPDARADFVLRLREAERQLSDYRSALHKRMERANEELIARYREEPTACLSALPLR